jgi:hypothetical protein
MIGLSSITRVDVPRGIVDSMRDELARIGQQGLEAFALWAGSKIDAQTFEVKSLYIPAQSGYKTREGVCVTVSGEALHKLNLWLYEHEMELIAQIHTHPTDAYHSDTDDAYPIVATVGAFSIVIPDFAARPFSWEEVAVYRLAPQQRWTEIERAEVRRIFG